MKQSSCQAVSSVCLTAATSLEDGGVGNNKHHRHHHHHHRKKRPAIKGATGQVYVQFELESVIKEKNKEN